MAEISAVFAPRSAVETHEAHHGARVCLYRASESDGSGRAAADAAQRVAAAVGLEQTARREEQANEMSERRSGSPKYVPKKLIIN